MKQTPLILAMLLGLVCLPSAAFADRDSVTPGAPWHAIPLPGELIGYWKTPHQKHYKFEIQRNRPVLQIEGKAHAIKHVFRIPGKKTYRLVVYGRGGHGTIEVRWNGRDWIIKGEAFDQRTAQDGWNRGPRGAKNVLTLERKTPDPRR